MADFPIEEMKNAPIVSLTVSDFYNLLRQAVRDGTLEANQKMQTSNADRVRKLLNG